MRRFILGIALLVVLMGALALYWLTRPLPVLTITTWPGAYGPGRLHQPGRHFHQCGLHQSRDKGRRSEA